MKATSIEVEPTPFALEEAVHPVFGLVKWIYGSRLPQACPNHFMYVSRRQAVATAGPGTTLPGEEKVGLSGAGMNVDHRAALRACFGEAIERYCSAHVDNADHLYGCELDLDADGVSHMTHEDFDYYADIQYGTGLPFDRWSATSTCFWKGAHSLIDGRKHYLPAQLIYVPYRYSRGESIFAEQISTGIACHRSTEAATLSGLNEVIERDAFTIFWLCMAPAPSIRIDAVARRNPRLRLVLDRALRIPNLELLVKDITTDCAVPTFVCLLQNTGPEPNVAAAFAAASHLNPEVALEKALNELLGTFYMAYRLRFLEDKLDRLVLGPPRWNRTTTSQDHVANFAFQEILPYFTWIHEGETLDFDDLYSKWDIPPNVESLDVPSLLKETVRRLQRVGLEAFATDLTLADVKEMGYRVVRVNVPGCVPLTCLHRARPLGCRRLTTVPEAAGWPGHERMNSVPHPYP